MSTLTTHPHPLPSFMPRHATPLPPRRLDFVKARSAPNENPEILAKRAILLLERAIRDQNISIESGAELRLSRTAELSEALNIKHVIHTSGPHSAIALGEGRMLSFIRAIDGYRRTLAATAGATPGASSGLHLSFALLSNGRAIWSRSSALRNQFLGWMQPVLADASRMLAPASIYASVSDSLEVDLAPLGANPYFAMVAILASVQHALEQMHQDARGIGHGDAGLLHAASAIHTGAPSMKSILNRLEPGLGDQFIASL